MKAGTEPIISWDLRPQSSAIPQPDYIPEQIKNDYEEACSILSLSPKASATLARRCLQGMIRDFWGISKGRLIAELLIKLLEDLFQDWYITKHEREERNKAIQQLAQTKQAAKAGSP